MAPYNPDAIPYEQWASNGALNFIPFSTHEPTPANDPSKVQLKSPYVVCVLGASRGIGAHIAYAYTKAGASGLVLASRRTSGLEETAEECRKINPNVQIEIVSCDIVDAQSVAALAEKTQAKFGRLDVAVINSGMAGKAIPLVTEDDPEAVKATMDVNYNGTFYAAKYLIPLLLKTTDGAKGFIGINTGASLLVRGPITNAKYCVSKMAQMRLLELIHEQYHGEGLASYAIHPGAVVTEMHVIPEHVPATSETVLTINRSADAPDSFKAALIDSIDLAGAWCVWLTKDEEQKWLSGRWISACWSVEDLLAKKDEIIEKDLAKLVMAV